MSLESFLDYLYGDKLDVIKQNTPEKVQYWENAFLAVQQGKNPKFNWPSSFFNILWYLKKRDFLTGFKFSLFLWGFGLLCGVLFYLNYNLMFSSTFFSFYVICLLFLYYVVAFIVVGKTSAKCFIKNYMKDSKLLLLPENKNKMLKRGGTNGWFIFLAYITADNLFYIFGPFIFAILYACRFKNKPDQD